jgi:hypothetical protein
MKKFLLAATLLSLPLTAHALPFGSVTLTQSGTSVNVDVVLNFGSRFIESANGGGELFLFNDSLAGSTITNVTAAPNTPAGLLTGFTNLAVSTSGGTFTASVECVVATQCDGASTPDMTSLSFTVTNATVAQLEVPNAAGNAFFADILAPTAAPEPATLAVLGVGLAGLAFAKRRQTA